MGLRQALPISNVPIYQELARRIGLQRMQTGIQTLGYGNQQIGTSVDTFWLKGPLKISALEQVDFLAKLAQGTLTGIPPQHQADVRAITRLETNQDCALYAKTGWATATDPELGWWIGWCVKNNHIYTFALNMDMRSSADGDLRIELGKKALRLFDLLLASTQPAP